MSSITYQSHHLFFFLPAILFYFSNFMHKLYTITVLICVLVSDSKVKHFMSVLLLVFADHLLMLFTHVHQSWYFSFCSHEFLCSTERDFSLVYLIKIFPSVCLLFYFSYDNIYYRDMQAFPIEIRSIHWKPRMHNSIAYMMSTLFLIVFILTINSSIQLGLFDIRSRLFYLNISVTLSN